MGPGGEWVRAENDGAVREGPSAWPGNRRDDGCATAPTAVLNAVSRPGGRILSYLLLPLIRSRTWLIALWASFATTLRRCTTVEDVLVAMVTATATAATNRT